MDWQQISSLTIVAAAAGFFAWRGLKSRRGPHSHAHSCGCPAASAASRQAAPSVIYRARKGERRQVIVKMK